MAEVLKVGDRSPRVAEVRATLARLGLYKGYHGDASRVFRPEDTFFDAPLSEALQAFQQSRGLIADGKIGEATLRTLREASYKLGERILEFQPSNELIGDDVLELQKQLHDLGFYPERLDGRFGELTHQGLMNYQMNYGLQADGICGPQTILALGYLGRRITGGSPHAIREREAVRQAGPWLAGKRVILDPGPGGHHDNPHDPARKIKGPFGEVTEEEILWDLASRIEGRMVAAGMETMMSRPQRTDLNENERISIANSSNADLMISLQCDHYPNEKANGCATFYFGSVRGTTSEAGELLSGFIQREICARTDLKNIGNVPGTWGLLRFTKMTAVEVVVGYLSSPHDVAVLTDPKQRDAIAEAVVVAVKRLYLMDRDDQPTGTYKFNELLEAELL